MHETLREKINWRPRLRSASLIVCALLLLSQVAWASAIMTASWYSEASLRKDGQWAKTKGVMSNGRLFKDSGFTCASCLYTIGSRLRITNLRTNKTVVVEVTDRTARRFKYTRVDLSPAAFDKIADRKQGIVSVKIEEIK